MKSNSIFWFVFVSILNTIVVHAHTYQACTFEGDVFNTTYHITYEDIQRDKRKNENWHDSIKKLFKDFDNSLSMFNPESIISAMNNNSQEAKANHYVKTVIEKSIDISKQTSGAFDITVAPLVNLWGFGFKNKENVTPEAVDSILQFVGCNKIRLDRKGRLHKKDPRIQLDASSIAKGYMCDIVGDWLKSKGVANYMVEIGGEIALHGNNPKGTAWKVGINVPEEDYLQRINGIGGILKLNDGGIATTGYPVQKDILSSTVIAPDCITADAYATAFMVMGYERAFDLLDKNPSILAYFIITDENSENGYKVIFSEGLKKVLDK